MAESDFSWLKIASFFGVAILVFVCFVAMAAGINQVCNGDAAHGIAALSVLLQVLSAPSWYIGTIRTKNTKFFLY